MTAETLNIEDITRCVSEGRRPRDAGPYSIQIGDAELQFGSYRLDDPVPTGRQVLEAVDARPAEEHLVFQLFRNGDLKELALDDTVDLLDAGVERFIVFKSAASYRIELDSQVKEWGACVISGYVLKVLAGANKPGYGVWMEVRGAEDRPIDDHEMVQLDSKGLERFFTGATTSTEGAEASVLPTRDRRYLNDRGLAFTEHQEGAQNAVVIHGYSLPADKYQVGRADILILLPRGYPDAAPDMFYAVPWLTLATSQRYPRQADQPLQFEGQRWQRWSRHNNTWRPGVDGIWTILKRVETALEIAA
ncbi:MAG TPA: hypothetical protein DFI00_07205 [Rhodospirillaceae bacterium]|nr:hypothetical protein [Alphaproteobacteria bacterium]OUT39978.1 MAG: hypothetical protein CBB62_11430 [Micavibrio sp. TMED2]HCI47064.1 hypothetical protein [Rhodospirillaceae bacterium]MAJ64826.1 hypothetical protein [Alphaproteobacteria bacterium]MAS48108.1 hypothetical protein [Alphaproteobacteria bacterium]